jgi:mRNA interferase HigB
MHVVSRRTLLESAKKHPDATSSLDAWYRITRKALWTGHNEVKASLFRPDRVGTCYVFNVGGNKYRLIARVVYADRPGPGGRRFKGRVYILHVLTHAEYDADRWKKDCDC